MSALSAGAHVALELQEHFARLAGSMRPQAPPLQRTAAPGYPRNTFWCATLCCALPSLVCGFFDFLARRRAVAGFGLRASARFHAVDIDLRQSASFIRSCRTGCCALLWWGNVLGTALACSLILRCSRSSRALVRTHLMVSLWIGVGGRAQPHSRPASDLRFRLPGT